MTNAMKDFGSIEQQFKDDPEKVVLIGIGAVSVFAMMFLGGIIASGIFLGICTALSVLLLLFKTKSLKPAIWNTVCDHPLLVDAILSFSILGFAATGVTGLIAGVTGALFTSAALRYSIDIMGKATDENGEEVPSLRIPFLKKKQKEITNEQQG